MSIKKVVTIVIVLLFVLAAVWFLSGYFGSTKQVYEGVLVHSQLQKEQFCNSAEYAGRNMRV